ncbi:hypothetical protein PVAP13_5KG367307, partial [Panicum virgatum]
MNLLCWNCRGVWRSRTVQELVRLVRTHNPKIVFLSETRQSDERVKNLRWRLEGTGGGLALFWDDNVVVDLQSLGEHHIDVLIRADVNSTQWRGTFIYGEARVQDRPRMWDLIRQLKSQMNYPWIMVGDFNEVMWSFEHFSNTNRREVQMQNFRDALSYCDLYDMGFSGTPWTYDNKQEGARNVRVRLDRAVASTDWSDLFANAQVQHLVSSRSDRSPLLVRVEHDQGKHTKGRILRYKIMWERVESLPETIKAAWESVGTANDLGDVTKKLGAVMTALKTWSSEHFGPVTKELEAVRAQVEHLMLADPIENRNTIKRLYNRMDELLYREEMMWLQRSRISWLQEGDRNTGFFHRKATWRSKKNKIRGFISEDNRYVENKGEMEAMATKFFQDLYMKDTSVKPESIADMIEPLLTQDMNEILCKPFTNEEISDALFQIGPLKAPGPDGFPARFFQRNWEVLRDEVIGA